MGGLHWLSPISKLACQVWVAQQGADAGLTASLFVGRSLESMSCQCAWTLHTHNDFSGINSAPLSKPLTSRSPDRTKILEPSDNLWNFRRLYVDAPPRISYSSMPANLPQRSLWALKSGGVNCMVDHRWLVLINASKPWIDASVTESLLLPIWWG